MTTAQSYEIGDKVHVVDQQPPAQGEIVQVSPKWAVMGPPAGDEPISRVYSLEWGGNHMRWINETHLTSA